MKGSKYIGRPIPIMQITNFFMIVSHLVKLLILSIGKILMNLEVNFLSFS